MPVTRLAGKQGGRRSSLAPAAPVRTGKGIGRSPVGCRGRPEPRAAPDEAWAERAGSVRRVEGRPGRPRPAQSRAAAASGIHALRIAGGVPCATGVLRSGLMADRTHMTSTPATPGWSEAGARIPEPAFRNGIGRLAPWRVSLRAAPYVPRRLGCPYGSGTWLWRRAKANAARPRARAPPGSQGLTPPVALLCLPFRIGLGVAFAFK